MSYSIDCPWCGAENGLDFCDGHQIGMNEIQCRECEKPFHFAAEPDIRIGQAFKTLPVKECKCPNCGFDYSKHVSPSTVMCSTLCPGCMAPVTFTVVRAEVSE